MRNIACQLFLLMLLSSCAMIMNRRAYPVKITSTSENDKVIVNGEVHSLPAEVKVKRSRKDLQLDLLTGTDTIHYNVRSSPTPAFAGGDLFWIPLVPLGYLVDLTTHYQITQRFFAGVVYRPTLYNVYPKEEFGYEHLISFDLGWRLRIRSSIQY